jgi:beta-N-acetylhexosaminidase
LAPARQRKILEEVHVPVSEKLLSEDPGIHLIVGFQGTTLEEELKHLIKEFRIGGVCLYKRNIQSAGQLDLLLKDAQAYAVETLGRPLWLTIDQEGGPVQRLVPPDFTRLPSAHDLSVEGPDGIARSAAAGELRGLGIQINLAPVLDLVSGGASHFMQARSLGSDPESVAKLGATWIRALQDNGVSATAKHYPGLGQAESDPHHFAPVIRWSNEAEMQRSLFPFGEAISAGVHCVMTSHALYPYLDSVWPATLSPTINHEWLRNRLRFDGVLLSDDLDMAAVSQKYSWEEMARQGLLSTIDFFLVCQRSENIEPFYRAFRDVIRTESGPAAFRSASLRRIGRLFEKHSPSRAGSAGKA